MRGVKDLDVADRTVLVRADLNVPLRDGRISDDTRIRAALPTLQYLLDQGASVVVASHLGQAQRAARPGSLAQARGRAPRGAARTAGHARPWRRRPAGHGGRSGASDRRGPDARERPVRAGRDEGRPAPRSWARRARGLLRRTTHSVLLTAPMRRRPGWRGLLPCAAGFLLQREVETIEGILADPKRPLVAIVGGSKVSDKILVLERFLEVADLVLVGGAMVLPVCSRPRVTRVGDSLCADEDDEHARAALAAASKPGAATAGTAGRPGDRRPLRRGCRAARDRRGGRARGLDGTRHRPDVPLALCSRRSPTPGRCSGTGRWAPSSWSRSRRAPARWPSGGGLRRA